MIRPLNRCIKTPNVLRILLFKNATITVITFKYTDVSLPYERHPSFLPTLFSILPPLFILPHFIQGTDNIKNAQNRKTISVIRTGVRKMVRRSSRELSHELSRMLSWWEINLRNSWQARNEEKYYTCTETDGIKLFHAGQICCNATKRRMHMIATRAEKVKSKVKVPITDTNIQSGDGW